MIEYNYGDQVEVLEPAVLRKKSKSKQKPSLRSMTMTTTKTDNETTEYLQGWLSFWFDDAERLRVAKSLQKSRIDYLQRVWTRDRELKNEGFDFAHSDMGAALTRFHERMETAQKSADLLLTEAELTKKLYRFAASAIGTDDFKRDREGTDLANSFLNHGNYLAYGLAATTLWVLGIPHGFAVMHGKTRRGALVFDVADLVKDALVLPWAFICAKENATEQEFRQQCLQAFTEHNAMEFMFDQIKSIALTSAGIDV